MCIFFARPFGSAFVFGESYFSIALQHMQRKRKRKEMCECECAESFLCRAKKNNKNKNRNENSQTTKSLVARSSRSSSSSISTKSFHTFWLFLFRAFISLHSLRLLRSVSCVGKYFTFFFSRISFVFFSHCFSFDFLVVNVLLFILGCWSHLRNIRRTAWIDVLMCRGRFWLNRIGGANGG